MSVNSENQDIPRYAQTERQPEQQPDGYAISFNEKEQLKYKGLMQAQQVQKPKSLRNDSVDPNEMSNPLLMLSDQKLTKKVNGKKKTKKKTPDFLSLNKKYINGRPKSKKFGLIDTDGLGRKNSNFNSTDNLLLEN